MTTQICFSCSPRKLGKLSNLTNIFFQWGWWNTTSDDLPRGSWIGEGEWQVYSSPVDSLCGFRFWVGDFGDWFRCCFWGVGGWGEKGHPWNKQFAPCQVAPSQKGKFIVFQASIFRCFNSLFHENFKDIFPNATPENKAFFKGLSTTYQQPLSFIKGLY